MSTIHIVFGPQGAGKSTYSKQLSQEKKAVRFSIDEWMWNLYGKDLPKSMSLRWIMERVGRCEQQIWDTAKQMASLGTDIILDLGFTKFEKREQFVALAKEQDFSVQIHYVQAPLQLRKQRVMDRKLEVDNLTADFGSDVHGFAHLSCGELCEICQVVARLNCEGQPR